MRALQGQKHHPPNGLRPVHSRKDFTVLKEMLIRLIKLLIGYVLLAAVCSLVMPLVTLGLGTIMGAAGQPLFIGALVVLLPLAARLAGRKVTSAGALWADGAVVVLFFACAVLLSLGGAEMGLSLMGPVAPYIYLNAQLGAVAAVMALATCAGIMLHGLRRSE